MNLTFKGFLKQYCQELAGENTCNLRRLVAKANGDAPRVAEPLLLFAYSEGKAGYLRSLSQDTWMAVEYDSVCEKLDEYEGVLPDALEAGALPRRYQNVWRAFEAKKHAVDADRRVSALLRERSLKAMERRGLTCYALCKALNLNKGNTYAYLHKGDMSKVSRETARRICAYATGTAESR